MSVKVTLMPWSSFTARKRCVFVVFPCVWPMYQDLVSFGYVTIAMDNGSGIDDGWWFTNDTWTIFHTYSPTFTNHVWWFLMETLWFSIATLNIQRLFECANIIKPSYQSFPRSQIIYALIWLNYFFISNLTGRYMNRILRCIKMGNL